MPARISLYPSYSGLQPDRAKKRIRWVDTEKTQIANLSFFSIKLHHYFFPHENNNFRAKTLHPQFLLAYIVIILFIQFLVSIGKYYKSEILGFATNITLEKIYSLINEERVKANLPPLDLSSELTSAAQKKANDMFLKNYWAHISPTGTTPWEFIKDEGYQYVYAGENLAKSFDNSDEVVAAWMKSPTHRANILKPEYQDIGLAVVNGKLNGEETTLVVQEFGTIAKSETSFSPIAQTKDASIQSSNTTIKPLLITKTSSLVVAEFLLIILFIDSIFIWKHKTMRIAGHSLAHIMFFLALLGAMGATGIGVIL